MRLRFKLKMIMAQNPQLAVILDSWGVCDGEKIFPKNLVQTLHAPFNKLKNNS